MADCCNCCTSTFKIGCIDPCGIIWQSNVQVPAGLAGQWALYIEFNRRNLQFTNELIEGQPINFANFAHIDKNRAMSRNGCPGVFKRNRQGHQDTGQTIIFAIFACNGRRDLCSSECKGGWYAGGRGLYLEAVNVGRIKIEHCFARYAQAFVRGMSRGNRKQSS